MSQLLSVQDGAIHKNFSAGQQKDWNAKLEEDARKPESLRNVNTGEKVSLEGCQSSVGTMQMAISKCSGFKMRDAIRGLQDKHHCPKHTENTKYLHIYTQRIRSTGMVRILLSFKQHVG